MTAIRFRLGGQTTTSSTRNCLLELQPFMANDGDKSFPQKCVYDGEGKGRDIEHVVSYSGDDKNNHDSKQ